MMDDISSHAAATATAVMEQPVEDAPAYNDEEVAGGNGR